VTQTRAEQLRHRADELNDEAQTIRYTEPRTSRHLDTIARDLRAIAAALPPERGQQ